MNKHLLRALWAWTHPSLIQTVNQNRELLNTFAGRFQAKQAEFHSFLKNNKKGEMNYE